MNTQPDGWVWPDVRPDRRRTSRIRFDAAAEAYSGKAALLLCIGLAAGENLSRAYVYAQRDVPGASAVRISCDGETLAEVKKGYFFAVNLRPGRHSLSLANGVPGSIDVQPGVDAFVSVNWTFDMRRSPIPVLALVSPERAQQEMRFLSYVKPNKIRSQAVAKVDPRPPLTPELKTRQPK